MWQLGGLDVISSENFCKISGRPSLYQIGVSRYIGGQMRNWTSGLELAKPPNLVKKSTKIGSTRTVMVFDPAEDVRKFVTQDKMHTFDSERID